MVLGYFRPGLLLQYPLCKDTFCDAETRPGFFSLGVAIVIILIIFCTVTWHCVFHTTGNYSIKPSLTEKWTWTALRVCTTNSECAVYTKVKQTVHESETNTYESA